LLFESKHEPWRHVRTYIPARALPYAASTCSRPPEPRLIVLLLEDDDVEDAEAAAASSVPGLDGDRD
jgi:hypothetical protein